MASILFRVAKALGLVPTPRGGGQQLVHALPLVSFSPRRGSREVLRAYKENAWLRLVVDTVAEKVATPRWRVYKRARPGVLGVLDQRLKSADPALRTKALKDASAAGELVELPDHELLRLLEAPHPKYPGRAYRKLSQEHVDLVGEAFFWLRRDDTGRVVGWEVVPPHRVMMTPTPESPVFFLSYNTFVGAVSESDVLWFKHLDPEAPEDRGAGAGMALGDELDTAEAISRATKSTFERGGVPAAIVGLGNKSDDDGSTTSESAQDLEARFNAQHQGPSNAGKVWFAPAGVSLAQVQVNFRELQTEELKKGLLDFIRQTYNVPPELVGDLTSSNRSTAESAEYTLADFAVLPRLEFWRTWLQHCLVPLVDRDAILDYDDPRPQEFERVFRLMTTQPTEAFTYNEVRELAGYEPDPLLEGKRPPPLPGAGGGNNPQSASANATPNPPRDRSGEEGRL
ncbi:phage portal protein [Corallococcus exiguus]|uniref:Phage portal protein n=1 Tax=Corallococcus exiguus TaxID=83462 RepID=A0A7X4Y7Q3_9BACT|nr:phage portal protein [Corallococcus exiguus]NBC40464.1 phage portal protein [Corallococcus exiguus]TNV64053.1 phage portal protein [Corallococcus exiguus]